MNKVPVTHGKRKPAAPLREEVGRFSAVLVGVASGHTCGGFGDGAKSGGPSSALQNGSATNPPLCKGLTHGNKQRRSARRRPQRDALSSHRCSIASTHCAPSESVRSAPDIRSTGRAESGAPCDEAGRSSAGKIAGFTHGASIRACCKPSYRQLIRRSIWRKRMRAITRPVAGFFLLMTQAPTASGTGGTSLVPPRSGATSTTGRPSGCHAQAESGIRLQCVFGLMVSHVKAPPDSRSMFAHKGPPSCCPLDSALRKYPTDVPQREAKAT